MAQPTTQPTPTEHHAQPLRAQPSQPGKALERPKLRLAVPIGDLERYKKIFEADASVDIPGFLAPDFADALHRFLTAQMPRSWWFASAFPLAEGQQRRNIRLVPANREAIARARRCAVEGFEMGQFSHFFNRSAKHPRGCSCLCCEALGWFNSAEEMELFGEIGGERLGQSMGFFASRYRSGGFLSVHSDGHKGRRVGVVYQLTRDWRFEYGGLLHLLEARGEALRRVVLPAFNTLMLFAISHSTDSLHFVSHVAPGVPNQRLAISGWYR